jgi:hypothetical protein
LSTEPPWETKQIAVYVIAYHQKQRGNDNNISFHFHDSLLWQYWNILELCALLLLTVATFFACACIFFHGNLFTSSFTQFKQMNEGLAILVQLIDQIVNIEWHLTHHHIQAAMVVIFEQ